MKKSLFILTACVLFMFGNINCTHETVEIKVKNDVLKVINSWDKQIWFFTSKSKPIKSLDKLKNDEVACWGMELFEQVFEFFDAAGIKYEDKSCRLIGTGNQIFDGMKKPPKLFITWSNLAPDLKGSARVIFVSE